jgi:G:T-mismatch repair DNA endonuclease (very short patch repair protein)
MALKKCWQREDYRARNSENLRRISHKGNEELTRLRRSGAIFLSEESRERMSRSQKLRFQRPEELKKLERARSLQVIDFQKRAEIMHEAFLKKYGSFLELAKMGMKAAKRKPSSLELEVAKILGDEWEYVGNGKLTIGGLVPDFVHRTRKEVLEVFGCYYHACPSHYPNAPMVPKTSPAFRESVYTANGYKMETIWEHDIKKSKRLAFLEGGVKDPSVYAKPSS